jgi:preprotein translocase subunit YajC
MKFLVFIIIILIFMYLLEKVVKKQFKIEEKKIAETPGKNIK